MHASLSRTTRHALVAALELARSGGNAPVTVADVARRYGIPGAVLAKVFQQLVRAGLALGTRGLRGGYRLARAPAEVTVLDVIEAFAPLSRSAPSQQPAFPRLVRLFDQVDAQIRDTFAAVTLEALAGRE